MILQMHGGSHSMCYHRCKATRRAAAAAAAAVSPPRQHMGDVLLHEGPADAVIWLHDQLESLGASYMFTGATAAHVQGAAVAHQHLSPLQLAVQWDCIQQLHSQMTRQLLQPVWHADKQTDKQIAPQQQEQHQHAVHVQLQPGQLLSPITRQFGGQQFTAQVLGKQVLVFCELNTVVQMNPNRIAVQYKGKQLWCESLLAVRSSRAAQQELVDCVNKQLQRAQYALTEANGRVWSLSEAGDAWVSKLGNPADAAAWIQQDPLLRLGLPLAKHMPQHLQGVRLINLMGSHGTKAVAAGLLGAHVTCVDLSPANVQYGRQLAAAAGADVTFVISDVVQLGDVHNGCYDVVLLELGVLHYFIDLQPLMTKIYNLLAPGGQLVLREFHPVSTKLITSKGKKHKVTGNYFSQALVQSYVAYSKYSTSTDTDPSCTESAADHGTAAAAGAGKTQAGQVQLRQWGLGEIVTSAAAAGLVVHCLEEEPGVKLADVGLPKLFTLVAKKPHK